MVCFNLATFGGVVVFVTLLWPSSGENAGLLAGRWTVARACPVRCNSAEGFRDTISSLATVASATQKNST